MLFATIALALALTGILWFTWPFLRIRARQAWHRRRGSKGPHYAVAMTRAEQAIGAKLAVPYGYPGHPTCAPKLVATATLTGGRRRFPLMKRSHAR